MKRLPGQGLTLFRGFYTSSFGACHSGSLADAAVHLEPGEADEGRSTG
jgi:hypothetical protein